MSKSLPSELNCFMFGHNFYKSKNISPLVDELTCKCCQYKTTSTLETDVANLSHKCKEVPSLLIELNKLRKALIMRTASFWS